MLHLLIIFSLLCAAEPFLPKSEDEILERLPHTFAFGKTRQAASIAIQDENRMLAEVRACLAITEEDGDPRLLGHAKAMLRNASAAKQSAEALVLRAIVSQRLHQFDEALQDLEEVLRQEPAHFQALLTKASILQVQGEYRAAISTARLLSESQSPLAASTMKIHLQSLIGQAGASLQQIEREMQSQRSGPSEVKQWMLGIAADIAERLGQNEKAERHYIQALLANPRSVFALSAYGDFLLLNERPEEALRLCASTDSDSDSRRLRELLAWTAIDPEAARTRELRDEMAARFEALNRRADRTHLREQSRFALRGLQQPAKALELALENWEVQREPIDALICLEAAVEAKAPGKAAAVIAWVRSQKLEDVRLEKLIGELAPR